MRALLQGLAGWARLEPTDDQEIQSVDTAITVVGTLLVLLGWMILRY